MLSSLAYLAQKSPLWSGVRQHTSWDVEKAYYMMCRWLIKIQLGHIFHTDTKLKGIFLNN